MATKLNVVEQVANIVPAPQVPDSDITPTRKLGAGWTAERLAPRVSPGLLARARPRACAHMSLPTLATSGIWIPAERSIR